MYIQPDSPLPDMSTFIMSNSLYREDPNTLSPNPAYTIHQAAKTKLYTPSHISDFFTSAHSQIECYLHQMYFIIEMQSRIIKSPCSQLLTFLNHCIPSSLYIWTEQQRTHCPEPRQTKKSQYIIPSSHCPCIWSIKQATIAGLHWIHIQRLYTQ